MNLKKTKGLFKDLFPKILFKWLKYYSAIAIVMGVIVGTIIAATYRFCFHDGVYNYIWVILLGAPLLSLGVKIWRRAGKKFNRYTLGWIAVFMCCGLFFVSVACLWFSLVLISYQFLPPLDW